MNLNTQVQSRMPRPRSIHRTPPPLPTVTNTNDLSFVPRNIAKISTIHPSTIQGVLLLVYPSFADIIRHISKMDLSQRSAIIKCCQAQTVPHRNAKTVLHRIISEVPPYQPPGYFKMMPVLDFANEIKDQLEGRVSSTIILDICRSAPVHIPHIQEARFKSWNKEILCCETEGRAPRIDWSVVFEGSNRPLLPGVSSNPAMAFAFRSSLVRWRAKISRAYFYPRMTRKNMSWDTRRNYENTFGKSLEGTPIFSQVMWQRTYMETGIEIEGVAEMRQKWYPSNAKPRTYYAQGGTHYKASCYLQDAFSSLVNSNPITHHVSRLQPTRLILPTDQHYLIYDLTSFTSRMWEQKSFTRHLGEFLTGVYVFIMDPRVGPILKDLGEMVLDYNDICNIHPQVSYERFGPSMIGHIAEHATASMLGIYGNLMTCTFAHAACVSQAADNENEVNVAGDDALVVDRRSEELDILIRAIGDYEPEKTFRSDEVGAICLKRPIWEDTGRLMTRNNCIAPNVVMIAHYLFEISDPRFHFFTQDLDLNERISIVGKDLMRFLRSVYRSREFVDMSQINIAYETAEALTTLGPKNRQGGIPNCGDAYFWPWIPNNIDEFLESDPLEALIYRRFRGEYVSVPAEGSLDRVDLETLEFDEVVQVNKDKHLSYLEKLGFIETEEAHVQVKGEIAFRRLKALWEGLDEPRIYNLTLLREIPKHLLYPC